MEILRLRVDNFSKVAHIFAKPFVNEEPYKYFVPDSENSEFL